MVYMKIKPMPKGKRMSQLIENLANLERIDFKRMSVEGKKYLGKIWNLLGMPSQEEIIPSVDINKPLTLKDQGEEE
tara:strand:- start:300 stop:527 length:228 start_codon:yes stop_codon:yes gene_type:complete